MSGVSGKSQFTTTTSIVDSGRRIADLDVNRSSLSQADCEIRFGLAVSRLNSADRESDEALADYLHGAFFVAFADDCRVRLWLDRFCKLLPKLLTVR